MAGMLPGVEVARRRRTQHRHRHHQYSSSSDTSSVLLRPCISLTSALDDTALKARARLEEKLRGDGSRWNKRQHSKDMEADRAVSATKSRTEMVKIEKVRGSDAKKLEKEVCAVCLEEIRAKQLVTSLPCSHSYHSDCLLPWLNAHPDCPYCRTHVPS